MFTVVLTLEVVIAAGESVRVIEEAELSLELERLETSV